MAQSATWTKLQAGTDQDRYYAAILSTIRQKGTQNPQYKSDFDMTYKDLQALIAGRVPGLTALLMTMKKKKQVDYNNEGTTMKDSVIITAIGDDDSKTTEFIPYTDILAMLGQEKTSHQKAGHARTTPSE